MTRIPTIVLAALLFIAVAAVGAYFVLGNDAHGIAEEAAEHDDALHQADDEHAVGEHIEPTGVMLTAAQRRSAGIVVEPLQFASMPQVFTAPGEVLADAYAANIVSPRISAMAVRRHAVLGETVSQGDPLVTMFSTEMAEAQSAYVLAAREFDRVQQLGRDIVSGRRFEEATVRRDEARARLVAYGVSTGTIAALEERGTSGDTAGQFELRAPRDGVIVSDTFHVGDVVEPGTTLFEIADLQRIWVDAHVSPQVAEQISSNDAVVSSNGRRFVARIIQREQRLDEITRTIGVRLEIENPDRGLTPGEFVDVRFLGPSEQVLALPTAALLQSPDGDWVVYAESPEGAFVPVEVEPLYAAGERTAIAGIQPGTQVVTEGAFFVMAEAAKAGFDVHAH